jgi:hypothetical protein
MSYTIVKNKFAFWIYATAIVGGILLALFTHASGYTYTRTPSGSSFGQGGITFHLAGDTVDLNGGDASCVNLEIWAGGHWQSGQYAIVNGFNQNIVANLPVGDYNWIKLHRTKADGYTYCGTDTNLESGSPAFSVVYTTPSPTQTTHFFQIIPDTETYRDMNITIDLEPRAIAERVTPTATSQLCAIETKMQAISEPYGATVLRLTMTEDNFSDLTTPSNSATTIINNLTLKNVASLSFVGDLINYEHFTLPSCYTMTAGKNYWFKFYSAPSGVRVYARNSQQNINISSSAFCLAPTGYCTWTAYNNLDFSLKLINEAYQGQPTIPPISLPATTSYGFTNRDFGVIGNYLRDVIVYLFYPDQNTLNQFATLYETIKQKPPIGYFTAIVGVFNSLSTGTPTITLDVSPVGGIFNPIRAGITVVLWFMLAFWILHRFRELVL